MEESDCQLTLIHTMIPKIFSSHISPFETEFWHQSQFTVGCPVRDIVSLKTRNFNIAELVLFTSWALSQNYRTTLSHNCTCPTWPDLLWFSPFLHRVGSHLGVGDVCWARLCSSLRGFTKKLHDILLKLWKKGLSPCTTIWSFSEISFDRVQRRGCVTLHIYGNYIYLT